MIVNVKGIGKIDFPDGMSMSMINDILTKTFKSKDKPLDEKAIVAIVKEIVEASIKSIPPVVQEIQDVVAPNVTVNPEAPDMRPIAEAMLSVLDRPSPTIKLEPQERARVSDIEIIERDMAGHIKRLRMTEVS